MEKKTFRNEQSRKWSMEQEKVASMKRRSEQHDYTDRGIYMITLAIEGRRPLLGTLTGKADATEGPMRPAVVLSPLGERVRECWESIPLYYPEVEAMKLCVMPDHIHGVLFVHERMDCHLGAVIKGFKAGTHRAARELGLMAMPAGVTATMSQCTETTAAPPVRPAPPPPVKPAAPPTVKPAPPPPFRPAPPPPVASVPYTATTLQSPLQSPPQSSPQSPPQPRGRLQQPGALWERGYNDRLLLHKGQLGRMLAYLDDNPRRLLLKRDHPGMFHPTDGIVVAGRTMSAMGNLALLDAPTKLQLQCSRHLYPNEIEQLGQFFLQAGRQGAVIVSPSISPGERLITTACLEQKIPLIVLLLKGFPPFFKPEPRYLIACAEGRLLLLAPYPWQNEKIDNMRSRCLELNALAATICERHQDTRLQPRRTQTHGKDTPYALAHKEIADVAQFL